MECVFEKILKDACEKNNVSYDDAVRYFYNKREHEYDLEDIKCYCEVDSNFTEEDYEIVETFTETDFDRICEIYRDDYDCDIGVWDNIYRAVCEYIDVYKRGK